MVFYLARDGGDRAAFRPESARFSCFYFLGFSQHPRANDNVRGVGALGGGLDAHGLMARSPHCHPKIEMFVKFRAPRNGAPVSRAGGWESVLYGTCLGRAGLTGGCVWMLRASHPAQIRACVVGWEWGVRSWGWGWSGRLARVHSRVLELVQAWAGRYRAVRGSEVLAWQLPQ